MSELFRHGLRHLLRGLLGLGAPLSRHLRMLPQHLWEGLNVSTEIANLCPVDNEISIPALKRTGSFHDLLL